MNFFNIKTSWSNIEFVPLKLCIATAYLFIGSHFHTFFQTYTVPVLIVFGITVVWSLYLWFSKMKSDNLK
jgi:hypothetical protein